jgi:hypothetical protein
MDNTQSFNETIGDFVQAVAKAGEDRRTSRRFAYSAIQSVAAYDGKQLPTSTMFCQVRCCDLSAGGISFVWPRVPDFEQVVIKLAASRRTLHVVARVVGHRPFDASKKSFLVGCKFLDRVRITV